MFRNILVVVDSSRAVHPELGRALALARLSQGSLHIVDVVRDMNWLGKLLHQGAADAQSKAIHDRKATLDRLVAECAQQQVTATAEVLIGTSSQQIIAQAQKINADLVIRYAKGQHSHSESKLGTTAQRLIRWPPCPLWLHRSQYEPIKRIVAAVDATPDDPEHAALNKQILKTASRLATEHQAELKVVFVWTMYGDHLLKHHMPISEYQRLVDYSRKNHADNFARLLTENQISSQSGELLEGNASMIVPRYCTENQVDLLICGTVARQGVPGLLLGNTVERIMNLVDCSILAMPLSKP